MTPPVDTRQLFAPLDGLLISLLRSLPQSHWLYPTIAKQWCVKDVAAHLLDGNIRTISMLQQNWFGEPPPEGTDSYESLVTYLNQLNANWVQAMKRVNPATITDWLEDSGRQFCSIMESLPPFDQAIFPVAWAGEQTSCNWMHVAREYTEKWHHQQQIRQAVGDTTTLMTADYFLPFANTIMLGLPHALRNISAPEGSVAEVRIREFPEHHWQAIRTNGTWQNTDGCQQVLALVEMNAGDAWPLFTKSLRPSQLTGRIKVQGNADLANAMLNMVSVMA